jgi:hypothetical protein
MLKIFFFLSPLRSHSFWDPVKGSIKVDGNSFEFQARRKGAGIVQSVDHDEVGTFHGSINPPTVSRK